MQILLSRTTWYPSTNPKKRGLTVLSGAYSSYHKLHWVRVHIFTYHVMFNVQHSYVASRGIHNCSTLFLKRMKWWYSNVVDVYSHGSIRTSLSKTENLDDPLTVGSKHCGTTFVVCLPTYCGDKMCCIVITIITSEWIRRGEAVDCHCLGHGLSRSAGRRLSVHMTGKERLEKSKSVNLSCPITAISQPYLVVHVDFIGLRATCNVVRTNGQTHEVLLICVTTQSPDLHKEQKHQEGKRHHAAVYNMPMWT